MYKSKPPLCTTFMTCPQYAAAWKKKMLSNYTGNRLIYHANVLTEKKIYKLFTFSYFDIRTIDKIL